MRKIRVNYSKTNIITMELLDKHDNVIGSQMGTTDGKDKGPYETKVLDVNAGEIITGVNIQEIGYHCDKGVPDGYNRKADGDVDEFHIGSIQFQLMQLGQTPKHMITSEQIAENLVKNKMLTGKNPYDMQNPITFTKDNKWVASDKSGTWSIVGTDETWQLKLKGGDLTDTFEFANFKDGNLTFNCVEYGPNEMVGWKIVSMPDDGVAVKMTLKSHPGKALVRDKRDDVMHEGGKVRWYEVGDEEKACIFIF